MTLYLPLHRKPQRQKNMRSACFTNTMHPSAPLALLCRHRCSAMRLPTPLLCKSAYMVNVGRMSACLDILQHIGPIRYASRVTTMLYQMSTATRLE